jgi:hypothetical protein
MIEITDEMFNAFYEAGVDRDFLLSDTRAGLAAVLAIVERDLLRGIPLPGEPVWEGISRKRLTLEMEDAIQVEGADLGLADRPSEVARLLRQAAADIEQAWREAKS